MKIKDSDIEFQTVLDSWKVPTPNYSKRIVVKRSDIDFEVGVYFEPNGLLDTSNSHGSTVGLTKLSSTEIGRLLYAVGGMRIVVEAALDNLLTYRGPGNKTTSTVAKEVGTFTDRTSIKRWAKYIADATVWTEASGDSIAHAFGDAARNHPRFKARLKWHLIWTGIAALAPRVNVAPYVRGTSESHDILHGTFGETIAMPVTSVGEPPDSTWWVAAGIHQVNRALFSGKSMNHDVKDLLQLRYGSEVPRFNGSLLQGYSVYWRWVVAWTVLHEISHLYSGTSDEVAGVDAIYFKQYDENRHDYVLKNGKIVQNEGGLNLMSFVDGTFHIKRSKAVRAYLELFTTNADAVASAVPADPLTLLFFVASPLFSGITDP